MAYNVEPQPLAAEVARPYAEFRTAISRIFGNVCNGHLNEASQSLLEVSERLGGSVEDLGEVRALC